MKQQPILIAIALTTTIFCGSVLCNCVTADTPDDRLFGNGRFLRRLRDDVVGKSKSDPKKKDEAKKPAKADPRSGAANSNDASPTPAKRTAKRAPTPAVRPPATNPSQSKMPAARSPYAPRSAAVPAKVDTRKDSKQTSVGFGMQIESKNDQLIVTKTDSKGNAAEAGVRKGDVVVMVGGVEIGSIEELEEITKILGNGDQLEFEIARRGKKEKVLIQFGEAPEEGEVVIERPEIPAKKVGNYNFLPEPAESSTGGFHSVLKDNRDQSGNWVPPNVNRIPQPATQSSLQPHQRASEAKATMEQQRLQIQQLKREIERLRQQTESTTKGRNTNWNSPSLIGPGK